MGNSMTYRLALRLSDRAPRTTSSDRARTRAGAYSWPSPVVSRAIISASRMIAP